MELREVLNPPRTAPFSRLRYVPRYATEEQLVEFLNDLLVKAVEARELGSVEELSAFLERWEDFATTQFARTMRLPESRAIPWATLQKPLRESQIALVTTGGIYVEGQEPFERGEHAFRELPQDTPVDQYRVRHWGYDVSGPQQDVNCVFPVERLHELEVEGVIGSLARTNYGFMGLIPDPEPLVQESAPEVARRLRAEGVDAVLLTST